MVETLLGGVEIGSATIYGTSIFFETCNQLIRIENVQRSTCTRMSPATRWNAIHPFVALSLFYFLRMIILFGQKSLKSRINQRPAPGLNASWIQDERCADGSPPFPFSSNFQFRGFNVQRSGPGS